MKVLKFGGTSVKNAENISKVVDIISQKLQTDEQLTIVCSALSGVTDLLIKMAELAAQAKDEYIAYFHQFVDSHETTSRALLSAEAFDRVNVELQKNYATLKDLLRGIYLVREASPRTMDYVLSFGERSSNLIIATAIQEAGIKAAYLDARRIIRTNKDFGNAKVNFETTKSLVKSHFDAHRGEIQVVTGFIGADKGGLTTTLGRGGSDYTAAILAASLDANDLEIWTDVDGVLTSDPRKVKNAFTVEKLSYAEAMELSHFGAKVIYPPTIQPALNAGIPIYIKNTFNPTHPGTKIDNEPDQHFRSPIKGISALAKIALLNIQGSGMMGTPGISGRLFSALAAHKINVILITQASSEHSISFAIKEHEADLARDILMEEFRKEFASGGIEGVSIEKGKSIVAVVGENMKAVPGIAGNLFYSLGKNGVNISAIAQGSTELNISCVIDTIDEKKALNLIHDAFFLSEQKRINIFIIGVGLIGGTLLDQISQQKSFLKDDLSLAFNVVGLSNSKHMLFDEDGIDIDSWKEVLDSSDVIADVDTFVQTMREMNLANSIFIDNTAGGIVPSKYKEILESSISIVTPNKIAASSSYHHYLDLKQTARRRNVQFLYETNVGAGLPVISTMQGLINSGDKIIKIDAILSGSMSYIFNSFDGSRSFSKLVFEAKQLGYTEPDPRDDLSGADVMRKIIILTREAGIPIESTDVEMEEILPTACMDAPSVDAFFEELEGQDAHFQKMVDHAKSEGKVLRLIASMEHGKAKVGLRMVDRSSPFYSIHGSDNMIVFTTNRYNQNPLIVRGPGAGAEVTAGGVFSDIISVSR